MSRTPETIIDKKAEDKQGMCFGIAIILGLMAWGGFEAGASGLGFIFACGAVLMFWIASSIKTTYHKYVEGAKYR